MITNFTKPGIMKKSIILICLCTLSFSFVSNAQKAYVPNQKTKLTALYLNIGGGTSNGNLSGMGLNFILSNNWGGSLGFNELNRKSKKMPSNYNPGSFLGFRGTFPKDKTYSYSIRFLREFPSNSKKVRYGLEGGLSIVKHTAVHFTKNDVTPVDRFIINLFTLSDPSNYNVSYSTKSTVGASFRAKLEFPLARWIGLELAAISNLNRFQSYVGGEIHLTIGLVRS